MRPIRSRLLLAIGLGLALFLPALPALAADEAAPQPAPAAAPAAESAPEAGTDPTAAPHREGRPPPGQVLAVVLLGVLLVAGAGCLLAVLRIVFPGPTALADASVLRMGTGRLLLAGILPAAGVALLGAAAQKAGGQGLAAAWGILLGLPALLLSILGAMAAIPHLGAGLLRGGRERSLLARSVTGALTLALAGGVAAVLQPVGVILYVVLVGWFLGAGLGTLLGPRPGTETAAVGARVPPSPPPPPPPPAALPPPAP